MAGGKVPRLLTIMGSGETAPTMVKVHRTVKERLASAVDASELSGVLLDTPYGFQMNADDLSARTVAYFRESVGMQMKPLSFTTRADVEGEGGTAITASVARAPLLFSGPGSPSYTLRHWSGTLVPGMLREKLALGGAVTFASAAALTLGKLTIPVYEIYKVGEDPHWLDGLDLLTGFGLPAVVIPHYDNAEGGTHDTRFCYLGEKRLSYLEQFVPAGSFVLGVDEHTAVILDIDAGEATVTGNSGVTIRVGGTSQRIESGNVVAFDRLLEIAAELASGGGTGSPSGTSGGGPSRGEPSGEWSSVPASGGADRSAAPSRDGRPPRRREGTPLLEAIRSCESRFREASSAGDTAAMVAAALALNDELWAWVADPNQSDELDRGKAALRAMVTELGALANEGVRDPSEVFGPFVDLVVSSRDEARSEKRFAEADALRDRLAALGIEIHDSPDGSTWERSAS